MTEVARKIRVVVADDCTLFREGLAELCRRRGLDVVACAADGREAVVACELHAPDVVLMDVDMPGMDGVAATAAITSRADGPRILMLSAHHEDRYVFEAIKAGAMGYLLKCCTSAEVVASVEAIHRGEASVDAGLAARVLAEFRRLGSTGGPARAESDPLTEGEMSVLRLVAQGQSNAEIARELCLASNTVANRLREIFRKLHVQSRTQAALVALRRGWATVEQV